MVREEPVCTLQLPGVCTYWSTTADHILPVKTHPQLAMVRGNLRGACEPCNWQRGAAPLEDAEALDFFL